MIKPRQRLNKILHRLTKSIQNTTFTNNRPQFALIFKNLKSNKEPPETYFTEEIAPWIRIQEELKIIYIDDGVTGIGINSFKNLTNVTEMQITETVNKIDKDVFSNLSPELNVTIHGLNPIQCSENELSKLNHLFVRIDHDLKPICGKTPTPLVEQKAGEKLNWIYFPPINRLTIYESGTLWDLESINSTVPWEKHRNEIKIIKIEDEVPNLGNYIFSRHSQFETLTGTSHITRIGHRVFEKSSQLKEFTINENVKTIGDNPFGGCIKLNLTLDKINNNYVFEDGILYNKNKTLIISYLSSDVHFFDLCYWKFIDAIFSIFGRW